MWLRLLMVACLSTAQSTFAEVTSTIKGSIESTENDRLPAGVVRLDSLSLGLSRHATSDIDGFYEFHAVPPAEDYLITIDYAGFAPVEVGPMVVGPGERLFLPLILQSNAATTSVSTGGRTLADQELQLYLTTQGRIAEAFRRSDGMPTIDLIVSALQDVDDLPAVVSEGARWDLVRSVSSGLGSVEPGDPLVYQLLSDPDARIQSMAIDLMQNDDAWLLDPAMRKFLQAILRSPPEGAEVVPGILLVYGYADRFAEVRPVAMDFARSPDPELSRRVASIIAWNHERGGDLAGLRRLFLQTDGILRQEAARFLANTAGLSDEERTLVATELVLMMMDRSLPADVRGDAIEASYYLNEEPGITTALLTLLEPEEWFFGVPGHHHPEHSLCAVLRALSDHPELQGHLKKLESDLVLLEPDELTDVERAVSRWVRFVPPGPAP